MSIFKAFHSVGKKNHGEYIEGEKNCIARIKSEVSEKTGVSEFIEFDDFSVAFAGTSECPQLLCEVTTMKSGDETYLYVTVDDEASWAQNEYDSTEEFENSVAKYIADRVGKTVKTVVKADKNEYRISSFYLDANGEWVCFEDESTDEKFITRIASKLAKTGETVVTYTLPKSEK